MKCLLRGDLAGGLAQDGKDLRKAPTEEAVCIIESSQKAKMAILGINCVLRKRHEAKPLYQPIDDASLAAAVYAMPACRLHIRRRRGGVRRGAPQRET